MRTLTVAILLLTSATAHAQGLGVTRPMAVAGSDTAKADRTAWADFIDAREAEISAMPPGANREAVETEWTAFVVLWSGADQVAEDKVAAADALIALGDATPNPMMASFRYWQSLGESTSASNTLANLNNHWDNFLIAINGHGYTPGGDPPS